MKIFVAGASGALGRQLLPLLIAAGHSVVGTTRTPGKTDIIRKTGAEPVVMDALRPDAVEAAIARARPDVIVHELTALPAFPNLRKFDEEFALTNRLRTEATDHLIAAANAAGVTRFVAQSYAGWPYARSGGPIKTEDDPLDPVPPKQAQRTLTAIKELEAAVTGATKLCGIVLRYGALYGPGTALEEGSAQLAPIRRRLMPVVGGGGGMWSFVHVSDAAAATCIAAERGAPGIYNIVDDDPAPVSEWLPALAAAIGAKPPFHVPGWLGRLAVGEQGLSMMTESRGASNAKAKQQLGWQPHFASWRVGFRQVS